MPRRRPPSRFFPVEAEKLLQAGETIGATELCKHGLVYFPENISGYAVLAQAYLMLDQPERALNVLEDGYRRTKAEGLRALCEGVLQSDALEVESRQEEEIVVEERELEVEVIESEVKEVNREEVIQPEQREGPSFDALPSDETAPAITPDGSEEVVEEQNVLEEQELHNSIVQGRTEVNEAEDKKGDEEESQQSDHVDTAALKEKSRLSIHSGTNISRLRSSNLRLIPGLEFAPLRHDESKLKIAPLVDPAPPELDLPTSLKDEVEAGAAQIEMPTENDIESASETAIEEPIKEVSEPIEPLSDHSVDARTPLEELARRLETARIPIVEDEEETQTHNLTFEPSIVSDTFAGILAEQGAYEEAIKAYQMLARVKPERRADYEQKIEEMRWKMTSVTNERTDPSEEEPPEL